MKKETVIIFTKFLLDFMYFAGIVVTLLLPVPGLLERVTALLDFHGYERRYTEIIVIYFMLGILAVLILGELRKMFRTVLAEDCFVKDNVVSLQRMGTYSFYHCGDLPAEDGALHDQCDAGVGAGVYRGRAV